MSHSKLQELLRSMQQGMNGLTAIDRAEAKPCKKEPEPVMPGKAGQVHRFMGLLEDRFGIHSSLQVESKLERIFEKLSENELRGWVDQLVLSPPGSSEWLTLVESLTIHETYFCRDKLLMWMLGGEILPTLVDQKRRNHDYTIKLLSAGCSTGEETYNIAMQLLQVLVAWDEAEELPDGEIRVKPYWRIEIIGTDVSRLVVHTASEAIYPDFGMGSFRDMPESRWRYFMNATEISHPLPGVSYYRVRPFVRKHVTFRQHNLLSDVPPETGCDLVICRNVMIYFQENNKRRVQDRLYRALAPGGVLILGGTDIQYWPERYETRSSDGWTWFVRK